MRQNYQYGRFLQNTIRKDGKQREMEIGIVAKLVVDAW